MNIVSTSPSGTEICCSIGIEPVAISHSCDYPPSIRDRPRIDTSSITGNTSAERHNNTQQARQSCGAYSVDVQTLRDAQPDLILTQEVCGVCAVDEALVTSVLADIECDPPVLALGANRLADVFSCIREVGEATGRTDQADDVITDMNTALDRIQRQAPTGKSRPRTLVIEWMDPLLVSSNWVPELVELAGGDPCLTTPGSRSTTASWSEIIDADPEVIVVAPCSYSTADTQRAINELRGRAGWSSMPAVQDQRVYAMDGSSYLNRWTPRLVDATSRLASIIHPTVFGPPPADVVELTPPSPLDA